MINYKNMLIALNKKGADIGASIGIDVCFAGRTADGEIYEPNPDVSYIKFNLIPNDVERRNLADGEAEVMLSGIYQASVFVGKTGKSNPDIESAGVIDQIKPLLPQGTKLEQGGQSCTITNSFPSPPLPDATHHLVALSVYFNCIA